jgi:hypothetical protein
MKQWLKYLAVAFLAVAGVEGTQIALPDPMDQMAPAFTVQPGETFELICPAPVPCEFYIPKAIDDMARAARGVQPSDKL